MITPTLPVPFVALVPVKFLALGKSRLTGIGDDLRRDLAVAFALDTLAAVLATPAVAEVVVVTSDPDIVAHARRMGCTVEPDAGDLNGSLRAAAERLAPTRPGTIPFAVCADLPALDAGTLGAALAQVGLVPTSFVADHEGVGTTLYAASYAGFDPCFGPGSRAAHRAAGAVEVVGDLPRLRRDVDSMADLGALAAAGRLGPHTRAVLAAVTHGRKCRDGGPPEGSAIS